MSKALAVREPIRVGLAPATVELPRHTLAELVQLGGILAKSGYFQDAKAEAQAVVKVLAGAELGISPIASMTGIHIVKGKVTIGAHLIASQVRRHPRYDYRFAEPLSNEVCELEFLDVSGPEPVVLGTSRFTMEDAKKASLIRSDSPWLSHSRNMLFARAMSNGAKWYTPDVFAGPVYTPDEMGAEVDYVTGEVIEVPGDPSPPETPGTGRAPARGRQAGGAPATQQPASSTTSPGAPPAAGNQGEAGSSERPAPASPSLSPGKAQFLTLMEDLGIEPNRTNRAHAIDALTKRGITSDLLTDEAKVAEAREALRVAFAIPRTASQVVEVPSDKDDGTKYKVTLTRRDADTDAACECEAFKFHGLCKHASTAWSELGLGDLVDPPIQLEPWEGIDLLEQAKAAGAAYEEAFPEAAAKRKGRKLSARDEGVADKAFGDEPAPGAA